jgi:hypothetical protein
MNLLDHEIPGIHEILRAYFLETNRFISRLTFGGIKKKGEHSIRRYRYRGRNRYRSRNRL